MSEVAGAGEQPATVVRLARWAVLAIFFINGAVVASWVAHIPFLKAKFGLSEAMLGLTLLAGAAGSVLALVLVGGLIARFGIRFVTTFATLALCATLPLLLLAPRFPLLILTLAVFGATIGTTDVAMNAQAVVVEERYRHPIMSTFHALFSSGGLLGALLHLAGVDGLTQDAAPGALMGHRRVLEVEAVHHPRRLLDSFHA